MERMKLAALAVGLVVTPAVFAQTYIVPDADCGAVTLRVSRGSDFPGVGEKIGANRVASAYVWALPEQRLEAATSNDSRSLTLRANISDEGVAMAAVQLKPEVSGSETRTEHAKALIFCGATTPAADWQRTMGLGLEIYPQGWNGPRPRLKPGDPMRFIAVDKATNKIVEGLSMNLYAGPRLIAYGEPAESGGVNFPYQEPGRYMVVATYRRPDPQKSGHSLTDTSTLTFDIK